MPVSILHVKHDECRWVEDGRDPEDRLPLYCGKKISRPNSSYCDEHHKKVFETRQRTAPVKYQNW